MSKKSAGNRQKPTQKRKNKGRKHSKQQSKNSRWGIILTSVICLYLLFQMVVSTIVLDYISPVFIPNDFYLLIFHRLLPISAIILTIFVITRCIKKFKTDEEYKNRISHSYDLPTFFGKLKLTGSMLLTPLFIWGMLWVAFVPTIELSAYYLYNKPWSAVFYVSEVDKCGSDYGKDCSRIVVRSLSTNQETPFHWYEDRASMLQLSHKNIRLFGHEGLLGSNVDSIQW